MPWWKPEEEESPQARVGRSPRIGATSRPVEDGERPPPRSAADEVPHNLPPQQQPLAQQQSWQPGQVPMHPPLPRRRLPFHPVIAVVAIVFVALFVLPFVLAFNAFDDADDNISGFDTGSHDGPSLVPRDRFAKALDKIRDEAGSESSITVLRVESERIDAVVVRAGGGTATIQVLPDLHVRTFSAGGGGQRGLSFGKVDPAVPERLVRRAAERLGVKPNDLNYMALTSVKGHAGGGIWSVFFAGGGAGRFATADLDGSNLRTPGS